MSVLSDLMKSKKNLLTGNKSENPTLGQLTICSLRWISLGLSFSLYLQAIVLTACSPLKTSLPPDEFEQLDGGQRLGAQAQVFLKGQSFQVEVAKSKDEIAQGLKGRTELADGQGMLFEFGTPQKVWFWAKDTQIPLDMIFLKGSIVQAIAHNVRPCPKDPCQKFEPKMDIDRVIEVKGGTAKRLNLRPGDSVEVILRG